MTTDQVSDALAALPPASELRGDPGHDQAMDRMRGVALMKDKALGFTYTEMAQRHGYNDHSAVRQALLRALDRHEADSAATLRAVENERYELDQRALRLLIADTTLSADKRIRAIDARTRSAARHARLNGMDAPVQVQLSAGIQAELSDALEELAEVMELRPGTDGVYSTDTDDPAQEA